MPFVTYHHLAREWRCRWSPDSDSASLKAAQAKLNEVLEELSLIEGEERVQCFVSKERQEFRVLTSLTAKAFEQWEERQFAPEATFLEALRCITGVSGVEARTFSWEDMRLTKKEVRKMQEYKEKEEAERAAEADPAKRKLKSVIKEGGKRGVEIEGAAELGNLQYFCTVVDEPEGDLELLEESVKAMNAEADQDDFGRKGGSGHIGKMVFSAGDRQLAIEAYVPEEKQEELVCEEWLQKVLERHGGGMIVTKGKDVCTGCIPADEAKGISPIGIKEALIIEANNYLRAKGLFPAEAGEGGEEEVAYGEDTPAQ